MKTSDPFLRVFTDSSDAIKNFLSAYSSNMKAPLNRISLIVNKVKAQSCPEIQTEDIQSIRNTLSGMEVMLENLKIQLKDSTR